MKVVRSRGTLDGIQPIEIVGIQDVAGHCVAVKVYCGWDGKPISWAISDDMLAGYVRIVEAL